MKKPDTIIDDIHTTRRNIEKKTKNMTRSERTAFYNQAGITAAKKYVTGALQAGLDLGRGSGPIDHMWNLDVVL